ncbi:unnamed protein product [Musa textilis]
MILVVLVCHMRWKCSPLKLPKPFFSVQQCQPMARILLICFQKRFESVLVTCPEINLTSILEINIYLNFVTRLWRQAGMNDLMQQAQVFVYANGKDHPPTAIDLDRSLLKELLFNQSQAKDVALALVAMRSVPFAPVLEKLSRSRTRIMVQ